jgi:hypothetical protein
MNDNRIMQQISAIFSTFMVLFYLGVGCFMLFFSDFSTLEKPVRVIIGVTFIIYGVFRGFKSYVKIVEVFFTDGNNNEE